MISTDLKLRFWAVGQAVYDLFLQPTLKEKLTLAGDVLVNCVIQGHIDPLPFFCVTDELPALQERGLAYRSRLVLEIKEALERLIGSDRTDSGFLPQYLKAQLRHLELCRACEEAACRSVMEDHHLTQQIREMLRVE